MDVISHGLWGGIAIGRKKTNYFWWAFFISMFPDISSFGVLMVVRIFGLAKDPNLSKAHLGVPDFINVLYNISHSLFVFGLVFLIVWILYKNPFWPLLAWGLHILIDIPSHSFAFFPTPFLWPFSDFKVNGISWGEPIIFLPNLILLLSLYSVWGVNYWKNNKTNKNFK